MGDFTNTERKKNTKFYLNTYVHAGMIPMLFANGKTTSVTFYSFKTGGLTNK